MGHRGKRNFDHILVVANTRVDGRIVAGRVSKGGMSDEDYSRSVKRLTSHRSLNRRWRQCPVGVSTESLTVTRAAYVGLQRVLSQGLLQVSSVLLSGFRHVCRSDLFRSKQSQTNRATQMQRRGKVRAVAGATFFLFLCFPHPHPIRPRGIPERKPLLSRILCPDSSPST